MLNAVSKEAHRVVKVVLITISVPVVISNVYIILPMAKVTIIVIDTVWFQCNILFSHTSSVMS